MLGSGPTSGAGVETDCVFIYTVSDGRMIREQIFFDRGPKPCEAVGLAE